MKNDEILELIDKIEFSNFNDLNRYFYSYFDTLIKKEKSQKVKNKYIKIRNSILLYLVANKKNILKQIKSKR
jgi:hypothetical protein